MGDRQGIRRVVGSFFPRLTWARADFNRGRAMSFRRPRRGIGFEGNPTRLWIGLQRFTVANQGCHRTALDAVTLELKKRAKQAKSVYIARTAVTWKLNSFHATAFACLARFFNSNVTAAVWYDFWCRRFHFHVSPFRCLKHAQLHLHWETAVSFHLLDFNSVVSKPRQLELFSNCPVGPLSDQMIISCALL